MPAEGVIVATVGAEVSENTRYFVHFESSFAANNNQKDLCGLASYLLAVLETVYQKQNSAHPPMIKLHLLEQPREIGAYSNGVAWYFRPLTDKEASKLQRYLSKAKRG